MPKSFSAQFEQKIISVRTKKVKTSKGNIDYKYPSHIRFNTKQPDEITFVSNPDKTYFYTAPFIEDEPGELNIKKSKDEPISKFFDVLQTGLVSNQIYKVLKNDKNPLNIKLNFNKEFQDQVGIKSAIIDFKGKISFSTIESIKIQYLKQDDVTLVLKEVSLNPKFKADQFVFRPPKNTKITGQ